MKPGVRLGTQLTPQERRTSVVLEEKCGAGDFQNHIENQQLTTVSGPAKHLLFLSCSARGAKLTLGGPNCAQTLRNRIVNRRRSATLVSR